MIIGLSGKIGAGKDTVAEMIQEIQPEWEIKKYSGKLKEIASLLTGIPKEKFESQDFKETVLTEFGMTVREFLQKLGTEAIRDNIHKDVWVNALFADYKQYVGYASGYYSRICGKCGKTFTGDKRAVRCEECSVIYPNWIITDVRFPNEYSAIKDRGGIMVKVSRSSTGNEDLHPSETGLDNFKFDHVIGNNSDLTTLKTEVLKFMGLFGFIKYGKY